MQTEVDRSWILIQSYRACWIRLGCSCGQLVCEFMGWLSSVCTNLIEARGVSSPRAPVNLLDHVRQQVPGRVPMD